MPKTFRCRVCGGTCGSDLYCSAACRSKRDQDQADTAAWLKAQGFDAHPDVENLFVKDGAALTLEEVLHYGQEKSLARHANVLRSNQR